MIRFFVSLMSVLMITLTGFADIASVGYASDASNLSAGTVSVSRLPVGDSASTVAAGNDARFNSVPVGQPTDTVGNNRVLVWFE